MLLSRRGSVALLLERVNGERIEVRGRGNGYGITTPHGLCGQRELR